MPSDIRRPRLFIASSREGLEVAYAAQQNLELDAEVVVWSQGVFAPSSTSLGDLIAALPGFSFGAFVFHPDDTVQLREATYSAVRDNVLFEFGLFAGRLGPERCFVVLPRGIPDFRWPSDLLGQHALEYEAGRADGNLRASLGPACHDIRGAMKRLGFPPLPQSNVSAPSLEEADQVVVLADWAEQHMSRLSKLIVYADLDRELRLSPGTTKQHIRAIAASHSHYPVREGPNTILLAFETPSASLRRGY
jgi:hypothetical protein